MTDERCQLRLSDRDAHGDAVDDERRAVVDEALGAQHRALAQGERSGEVADGRGVRGRQGGAHHEGHGPRHPEPGSDARDGEGGRDHQERAVDQDDAHVAAALAQRGRDALPEQDRGKEQQQDRFGRQLHLAERGDESQQHPHHELNERQRDAQARRKHRGDDERRADGDDRFECEHG